MAPTKNNGKMPIIPFIGEPSNPPIHHLDPQTAIMAIEVLDVPPLAMCPPTGGYPGVTSASGNPPRGRPTLALTPGRARSVVWSMSPRRGITKPAPRPIVIKRPTTGLLRPKGVPESRFVDGRETSGSQTSKTTVAISIKTIDTMSMEYTTSYSPSTPTWMKGKTSVGGGPGHGKVIIPPLESNEQKALRESLESASLPKMIRRKCDPPSINGPPGHFEDDGFVEKSDMEKLFSTIAKLRTNNAELEERLAKERMARLDLEDNFCNLRIGTGAKLRRLARAVGKEDVLAPPSP